jgi:cytidylate kinase
MKVAAPPIVIAIDGGSSCGKSTLAKALAKQLDYTYIDTGAMYRAVTLFFLRNGIPIDDPTAIEHALNGIDIHFAAVKGENHTFLNGRDVSQDIRSMEVAGKVSEVAALPQVRHFLVAQQRRIGSSCGVVMDGRDIGTVVFPHAALKVFLQANLDIRARRRHLELQQQGTQVSFEEVLSNLSKRDQIDSGRSMSPLKPATDAVIIDTTDLDIQEMLDLVLGLAKQTLNTQMLLQ